MQARRWTKTFLWAAAISLALLLGFTTIVDPFNVTRWNLLGIGSKIVDDDRLEKVARLRALPRVDNLLLGSSRVYGYNSSTIGRYLKGTTYNAGVGTARPEDLLGFLLFLEREGKFPKNVVVGFDFYSFNAALDTNKYFIDNRDLNFLTRGGVGTSQWDKFLSPDAVEASWRVLVTHLKGEKKHPKFGPLGDKWDSSSVQEGLPPLPWPKTAFSREEVDRDFAFIRSGGYASVSSERLEYVTRMAALCQRNHARLVAFVTPVNGQLLDRIEENEEMRRRFAEWKKAMAGRLPIRDFARHSAVNDTAAFFTNPTHATPFVGNVVIGRLFDDPAYASLADFGVMLIAE